LTSKVDSQFHQRHGQLAGAKEENWMKKASFHAGASSIRVCCTSLQRRQ